ncbi:hypothetical protein EGT67_13970 [Prescottella agglutinans]|uniref:Tetratricopeptide repeat protein n=1 Tax=Prescottella agglutinans TaxID=1644129 RepID=A0A3S3BDL6_9NOCA|nr:hypothetical protein EGT67_13970 [Prescottella agglutinans]
MSESSGDRRNFRGDGSHRSEGHRGGRPTDRRGPRDDRRQGASGQERTGGQGRSSGQWRDRDDRRGDERRDERGGYGRGGERRDDNRGERRGDDRRQSAGRGGDNRGRSGGPHRRGGEGSFGPARGRENLGPQRRDARPDEPDIPEELEAGELDPAVRRDLLSLDKNNANTVARHLVMASRLIEDDPRLALAHARAARQRAGRIAVVRETAGITAYHAGEWAEALSELRAARRMSGGPGFLAVMADCERGLGRPERAIELGRSDEARALTGDEASELRMVVAGARMDLGQFDQAVVTLQTPDLDAKRTGSAAARLFYAYADALVAAGRVEDGLKWFLNSAAADLDGETDAEERVAELTGEGQ